MKIFIHIASLAMVAFSLTACITDVDDGGTPVFEGTSQFSPVYMSRFQLENSIRTIKGREPKNISKIFMQGNKIYLVEKYKGVHIINNSDKRNPQSESFIAIPGVQDAVVKSNILICDNAIDVIGVDINDTDNAKIAWRKKEIMPALQNPGSWSGDISFPGSDTLIIVDWINQN